MNKNTHRIEILIDGKRFVGTSANIINPITTGDNKDFIQYLKDLVTMMEAPVSHCHHIDEI